MQDEKDDRLFPAGVSKRVLVEVALGIGLAFLFAYWRSTDSARPPLPYIQSLGSTVLTIGALGVTGLVALISRSSRRLGKGLLLIAAASLVAWPIVVGIMR